MVGDRPHRHAHGLCGQHVKFRELSTRGKYFSCRPTPRLWRDVAKDVRRAKVRKHRQSTFHGRARRKTEAIGAESECRNWFGRKSA